MTKKIRKSLLITSLLATSFFACGVAAMNNVSAKAETADFATAFGASVRVSDPNGIRFKLQLSEEKKNEIFAENSGKELGMYIMLGSKAGTDYSALTQKIDIEFEENDLYKVGDYWYANGVMTDLYIQSFNKEFVGVGYVATTTGETTTYEYSDLNITDNVRSMSYVAIEAYKDPEAAAHKDSMAKLIEKAAYAEYGVTETRKTEGDTTTYSFVKDETSWASYEAMKTEMPVSISVSANDTNLLVGETLDLNAALEIADTAITALNVPFNYSVDTEGVVTLQDGVVTAYAAGEANVTVSFGNFSQTVAINVSNPADVIVNTNSAAALKSVVMKSAGQVVDGVQTAAYSTEYKYGDEKGSIKITAVKAEAGYMVLSTPLLKDVSAYDYLEFYVYNPNAKAMRISPVWGTACAIEPNEWSAVRVEKKYFNGSIVDPWSGVEKTITDITNTSFYVREIAVGESVYISSVKAVKDASTIAENVIVSTDMPSGVSNLTLYNTNLAGATHTIAYSSAVKHGDEKGSFRLTVEGKNATINSKDNLYYGYMVISTPMLKDVSAYDYIQFHVYNPNATDMKISTVWKDAFTIPAKSWGTVTLYVADIKAGSIKTVKDKILTATDITNVAFYVRAMNMNEYIFISSIKAYKNA